MLAQIALPYTKDQIYQLYQKISGHEKMIINVNNQTIKFE